MVGWLAGRWFIRSTSVELKTRGGGFLGYDPGKERKEKEQLTNSSKQQVKELAEVNKMCFGLRCLIKFYSRCHMGINSDQSQWNRNRWNWPQDCQTRRQKSWRAKCHVQRVKSSAAETAWLYRLQLLFKRRANKLVSFESIKRNGSTETHKVPLLVQTLCRRLQFNRANIQVTITGFAAVTDTRIYVYSHKISSLQF